jgi:hypothetical protein
VHEREMLHKELREAKATSERKARRELRTWQRALLRAHHNQLRLRHQNAELEAIEATTAEQQVASAIRWAEGLDEVGAEASDFFADEEEGLVRRKQTQIRIQAAAAASIKDMVKQEKKLPGALELFGKAPAPPPPPA